MQSNDTLRTLVAYTETWNGELYRCILGRSTQHGQRKVPALSQSSI